MVLRGRGPPFVSLLGPEPALSTVPLACRAPLDHVPMLRAEPPPDATHPPPSRWHLGPASCSGAAISIHCPRSMGEEAGRAPPTPSPSGRSVGPLLGIADELALHQLGGHRAQVGVGPDRGHPQVLVGAFLKR